MENNVAPWPWKSAYESTKEVVFDAVRLAAIRRMAAGWMTGEAGAACLFDEELEELSDFGEDDFSNAADLFLRTAKIDTWKGTLINPYSDRQLPDYFAPEYLDSIPDSEIASELKSGKDIAFEATKDDLALWNTANINGSGIDTKRPFGTGHVSRDIRDLVDPEKLLSSGKFSKWRKTLESRLVLMLQFFVQNAELPFDTYVNDKHFNWVPASSIKDEPEMIDFCEWYGRCVNGFFYANQDYLKIVRSIAVLAEDNRIRKNYSELVKQFELDNFFTSRAVNYQEYKVTSLEALDQGYRHFPGAKGDIEQSDFALMLVRVLNSQARFAEACELLEKSGHLEKHDKSVERLDYNVETLFLLESMIARFGNGDIDETTFSDLIEGRWHDQYNPHRLNIYFWARETMFATQYPEEVGSDLAAHAQAAAAQLFIIHRCLDRWYN